MKLYRYFDSPHRTGTIVKIGIISLLLILLAGGFWLNWWYRQNIMALEPGSDQRNKITVESGMSIAAIAEQLQNDGIIRSSRAFVWYVKTNDSGLRLLAGTYSLGPSQSVAQIVEILSKGLVDTKLFTFLPGRRLDQSRQELLDFGFSDDAVNAALTDTYSSPVLAEKPASSTLEGYLFPDSYEATDQSTLQDIIEAALENFWVKIEEEDILSGLSRQGLSLHEAVILASIVEKEAGSEDDKAQIAQVFLSRLEQGIVLGADATFVYAAAVNGVETSVDIDSPYNTRIYGGLPPGPIANFNISALQAVAYPAEGDYLYFVTGDDGITRFSRTYAEHRALVTQYCQERCQLP